MKLNTLLLTSAATLMATSVAFAADLPSKKAAPAAGAVQACKVGTVSGFKLPGSDTCVSIGGFVRVDNAWNGAGNGDLKDPIDLLPKVSSTTTAELDVNTVSNTEMGALNTFISYRMAGSNIAKNTTAYLNNAYIQWNGLKAGYYDSEFSTLDGGDYIYGAASPSVEHPTLAYQLAVGGATLGVAYENSTSAHGDNGDFLGLANFSAGGVGLHVAAVAHDTAEVNGYGFDASAKVALGKDTSIIAEYAYLNEDAERISDKAGGIIGNTLTDVGTKGQIVAVELSHAFSPTVTGYLHGTYTTIDSGSASSPADAKWDQALIGAGVDVQPVKGLHFIPEVQYIDLTKDASGNATRATLRIERDF